jgi:hypothetical protein
MLQQAYQMENHKRKTRSAMGKFEIVDYEQNHVAQLAIAQFGALLKNVPIAY